MKCVICKTGSTHAGKATVTLQRNRTIVVMRDVPAEICEECGEYYLDKVIAARIHDAAADCVECNVEIGIQSFAA